jgi:hypothetical protein
MRYLLTLCVLVLAVSVGVSQTAVKIDQAKNFRVGTAMTSMAYTSTKIDTTQAINPRGYKGCALQLWAHDSASVAVYYQPSYNGVLWYQPVFIDSLSSDIDSSSATVVGGFFAAELPDAAKAYPAVRFVIDFNPFRAGVTSARFDARIVRTP